MGLGKCSLEYHEETFRLSPSMLSIGNTEMKISFCFCVWVYISTVGGLQSQFPEVGNSYVQYSRYAGDVIFINNMKYQRH
jgi:hypothetical protein